MLGELYKAPETIAFYWYIFYFHFSTFTFPLDRATSAGCGDLEYTSAHGNFDWIVFVWPVGFMYTNIFAGRALYTSVFSRFWYPFPTFTFPLVTTGNVKVKTTKSKELEVAEHGNFVLWLLLAIRQRCTKLECHSGILTFWTTGEPCSSPRTGAL